MFLHCVSKNIPNFFDYKRIFLTQLAIKLPFSFFYLTQCMLLHYLGKADQAQYVLK